MRALERFDRVEDIEPRALLVQKGVGRKTIREIAEVFAARGYPDVHQAYRESLLQLSQPAEPKPRTKLHTHVVAGYDIKVVGPESEVARFLRDIDGVLGSAS